MSEIQPSSSSSKTPRRQFLKGAGAVAAAGVAANVGPNLLLGQAKGANERFRTAVMGLGRGRGHINGYLDVTNCEVAYVCDVDSNRLAAAAKGMVGKQEKPPQQVTDFRRILDDPNVDAISIAAPNFWHAPAAIHACKAGKHVYVEKPGSYNPWEAKRMVEVAKETNRKVQLGTQRRSYPGTRAAIQKVHEGAIGKTLYTRCWYTGARGTIGKGKLTDPPAHLDWELWQGPVPDRPYKDNLAPYNWHWHWEYGGGEMANNGPHFLDIARWAMQVDYPERVSFLGGRYHFDDDQETPDTGDAVFEFGDKGSITFHISSCHRRKPDQLTFLKVYGENGVMDFTNSGFKLYDLDGKLLEENKDKPSDVPHFQNFADAVREGKPLVQPIEEGQISTMMCHLANIAYRTDGAVNVDPATGNLAEGEAGKEHWQREKYRETWADL